MQVSLEADQPFQDKFDRLEQGKNRDREIDAEMDEIRKKFRALKSEKEVIQADCKRIKEELEVFPCSIPNDDSVLIDC